MKSVLTRSQPTFAIASLAALAVACGGPGAKAPTHQASELPAAFVAATHAETTGDDKKALELHENVIQTAVGVPSDAHRVAALLASLDAVAEGGADVLRDVTTHTALLDRTKDAKAVVDALATDFGLADDPFSKGLLAQTLAERAENAGDARDAERWRTASGCVRDAIVIGPVDWTRIASVNEPGPLTAFDVTESWYGRKSARRGELRICYGL